MHEHYFDGLAIVRVQDNFVVQWNDPEHSRTLGNAHNTLDPEFSRPAADLPFTPLADPDTYAAEVGFVDGLPAAREPRTHLAWLVHCYAMVGVGRDNDVDSGNGSELYVVIGQAPRQLDRNVALVGRVVAGMEQLASAQARQRSAWLLREARGAHPHPLPAARRGGAGSAARRA